MTIAKLLHPSLLEAMSVDRFAWHPACWCFRGVTTALAIGVSGTYGLLLADQLGTLGVATLVGAAIAWPILLATVWVRSSPAWRFARLDWCLWTMTVGSMVMTLGLFAAALVSPWGVSPLITLLGGLFAADIAMGWVMTRYAPAVGIARKTALLIWVAGMNGFLAGVLGLTAWLERIV